MENGADNPIEGTGIEQAAQAFEAMLAGEDAQAAPQKKPKVAPKAEDVEDDEEAEDDDVGGETVEDDSEDVEDDSQEIEDDAAEEVEADAEDEGEDDEELDRLVTVTVDGKTEKIPLREAIAGYQRQADYSRKTAALAEERRAFYSEAQAVQAERQQYAALLGQLANQIQGSEPEPNWEELQRTDPFGFTVKWAEHQQRQQKLAAVQMEQMRVAQAMQQAEEVAYQQHLQSEREKLLTARPEWRDEKVWNKAKADIREYAKTLGFSDAEIAQTSDHRAVLALYKAMQLDRAANRKERPVTKPKQAAPKIAAPVSAPPTRTQQGRKVTELTRAKQRLAKTGSVQDAAKAFELLL